MRKTIFNPLVATFSFILVAVIATTSCNEPSVIGADVINPDRPDVETTDTLTILATSVKDDSIQTFDDLQLLSTYMCGNFIDPILGHSEAIINTELRLSGTPDSLVFVGIGNGETVLDSVVFALQYDTAGFYGKKDQLQDISVLILDEEMDNNATYFSDEEFAASEILTSGTFNPMDFDTTFSIPTSDGSLIKPPQLRMSIDKNHPLITNTLWTENSLVYFKNDTSLLDVFRGVQIQVENETELMMAFNLRALVSGMYLYYRTNTMNGTPDTITYRFQVNENAAQMVQYKNDLSNSIAKEIIETGGDSLIFIQGMSGLDAQVKIPYAQNLDNAIINQATLVFTVATILPDDEDIFYDNPVQQILVTAKNEDGDLEFITDVDASIFAQNIPGVSGGDVKSVTKNGVSLRQYSMNITNHFQDMVDGIATTDELVITAIPKAQSANRSIIFGANHSTYPIKLNITYTINQ